MVTEHFDVVVIGAGIQGAGITQAAASYGYKVLVLEKSAIAAGTSRCSSKLIHGGLRYLESGQFALVRECLRERNLLLRLAPELVRMRPFYIPVYEGGSRSPLKISAGLSLYAALNGWHAASRYKRVPPSEWDRLDGLKTTGMRAVFRYYDAQTDDLELTRAVLQSALRLGAELRLPAQFVGATIDKFCELRYVMNAIEYTCTTNLLINAAGPWARDILALITPAQAPVAVDLVQGTHIVLPARVSENVYYLEAPQDKRAVFVMPWKHHTLVGTTETPYLGSPDAVQPLAEEVAYLLETYSHYFRGGAPACGLAGTIMDQFAGLRVLPTGQSTAFRRPRDTTIHLDNPANPKVISVLGGKLTAYRATAEKVMRRLLPALPAKRRRAHTTTLPLPPADSQLLN